MKVYNTLTKKKEEFVPIEENKVKMYVCGPTVYGLIHIGNARPYVIFDTIRRYMEYKGYEVTYVQNFTDVDDKIIKRANEEGVSTDVITERYIKEAIKDAEGLNVEPATYNPRATKEMPHIIEMIKTLVDRGYAYEKNGSVYYDTKAFPGYGKLSGKNLDDLIAGASNRVDVDTDKKSPADFVLWKPKKEGEPYWESPWSEGRPGWHIECSVMAKEYLGDTIDIHAGGEDLIFPHHENEIAQSEAANGKPFANYWLHNGFINVDNEKMSKSKGNFFTLRDIVAEVPYDVVRFFILNGHYRSPINFSRELMDAAGNGLMRIKNCVKGLNFHIENSEGEALTAAEEALVRDSAKFKADFEKAMDDDFNTADAIASIFEFVKFANTNVKETSTKAFGEAMLKGICELCDILGIKTADEAAEADTAEIEALIAERTAAKKARDFAKADEIRNRLSDMGVVIEDTRQGVRWSFK
ncbi:MAG: cysteine--tRNA ligase [Clostridiales bacterium]|nr:cysteine--tRNA ligase [Clostridiales bacterium]